MTSQGSGRAKLRREFGIMHPDLIAAFPDGDGTLFDTEPLIHDVWRVNLAARGRDFGEIDYSTVIGKKELEVAGVIRDRFGLDESPEELLRQHQEALHDRMAVPGELKAKPGAEKFLIMCRKAGIPPCLVTSAAKWHADLALKMTGLRGYFRGVVTADSPGLKRFKPHPDPYLLGIKTLHVERREIHRCLALEDSPSGARSARDAGLIVVGIPSAYVQAEFFKGIAHHVIPEGKTLEDFELTDIAHLLPQ